MPLEIGFTRFKFTLSGKFTRFQFTPYNINAYRAKFTSFQFILKKRMTYDSSNWFSIVRDLF